MILASSTFPFVSNSSIKSTTSLIQWLTKRLLTDFPDFN
jgi:hypothetical protein